MTFAIRQQLVPATNRKVLSGTNPINSITVHQTGNTNRGANAAAHANLQTRGNPGRNASWHYQVDDKEAVQSYLDTDRCMHAGDGARGPGNNTSIAVEICINSDGDYKKAIDNGAHLVAILIKRHELTINNTVQHQNWSGKNCPAQIRAGKNGVTWNDFLALVTQYLGSAAKPTPTPKSEPSKTIAQMATEVIAGKHGNGHANRQRSLSVNNTIYQQVRTEVNRRVGISTPAPHPSPAPTGKTIAQMATEVIAGKHGNGHTNRQHSLGITNTTYQQVRAEVNRRLQ